MTAKQEIFEQVLTRPFSMDTFVLFTRELLVDETMVSPNKFNKEYGKFSYYIAGYTHIANYFGNDRKKIAIFAVELKRGRSVERERSMQRSFARKLMEDGNCDAALAAFHTAGEPKWRLSFIRMDYEFAAGRISEKLTPVKRYSYLAGEGEPCHIAKSCLYPIFEEEDSKPSADEIEEAFSVERVTREFFGQYSEKYRQVCEWLERSQDFMAEAGYRSFTGEQFAKKLMGLIAFFYLIQKKGWLGIDALPGTLTEKEYVKGQPWGTGPEDFMRRLFVTCEKKNENYFNDYLEPLFHDALNMNRGENGYFLGLHCRIPFLNGGLFEQLDNYRQHNNFAIPNEIFSNTSEKGRDADGILDIFDQYNFTMNEDEPMEKEVAIDPEMLGRVFENLLDVKDRKSKGVFYTPREIVHYMCRESISYYLVHETGLPYDDVKDFILYGEFMKDEDTACGIQTGSGAMLIPASIFELKSGVNRLKEIDDALSGIRVADPAAGSGAFLLGMLSEIVRARQNISAYMGISMTPRARRIMYAFDRHPYALKANAVKNCIFAVDIEQSAVDIAKSRLWLSLAVDGEINLSAQNEPEGHTKPEELPDPDCDTNARNEPERQLKSVILPDMDCNIICGNSLADEFEGIPYCLWELEFGRVFHDREKGGFDIIIGNPPYIDSENMVNSGMEDLRNTIASNYKFTQGNWDIYIAFFEKSFRMLSANGILSFITPDKWISKPFGDEMRKNLIMNIHTILAAGRSVFESALVDSIITFVTKREYGNIRVFEMADRKSGIILKRTVDKKILSSPYALDIIFSDAIGLIGRLETENGLLGGRFTCENACATSDCYRLKDILYSLESADEFSTDNQLKVTNTGTIGRFVSRWGIQPMTYLKDKYPFPVADRSVFLDMFTNTYGRKSVKKKIIIKGLTLLDSFIDFDGTVIPGKSTMMIPCDDERDLKYLSAVVNCRLMIFFIRQKYSSSSYNGGINFTKDMINHLPWREPTDEVKNTVAGLVDEIIARKQEDSMADTGELERRIDQIVYELYGLAPEEIVIVEKDT